MKVVARFDEDYILYRSTIKHPYFKNNAKHKVDMISKH